jgi:CRISPR-associated protein (TIGR02710 family)
MGGALIASVGGTPEPIVESIKFHSPSYVCFLASHQSVDVAADVKRAACLDFKDQKEIVEDPEDLVECYKAAIRCFDRAEKNGFPRETRIVDVTGGTKAMTAALALAATRRGAAEFSYIGGSRRDKGGLGVVQSGFERLVKRENPWQIFAEEEKRRAAADFNAQRFDAAHAALSNLSPTVDAVERALLEPIARAAKGFACWDRFQHSDAVSNLKQASQELCERLKGAPPNANPHVRAFAAGLNKALDHLFRLREETHNFKTLSDHMAADLLANAQRRIRQGQFDDAVARLYRAIEMIGQVAFRKKFSCETGDAKIDALPESLRDDFARKYRDPGDQRIKLPLLATFRALEEAGAEVGKRFAENRQDLTKILSARNQSILAHGATPITDATANEFVDIVRRFLPSDVPLAVFTELTF